MVSHFKIKVSDLGFFELRGENFNEAEFEELVKRKNSFEKKIRGGLRRGNGKQTNGRFLYRVI